MARPMSIKQRLTFNDDLKRRLKNSAFKKHFERYDMPVRLVTEMVRAREKAGLTQARLAKRVGVPTAAIARLESGDVTNLRLQTIAKMARALRPHFSFLIGGPTILAVA